MINSEGMTWPEWAYAAGIREPAFAGIGLPVPRWDPVTQTFVEREPWRRDHYARGYARLFRRERRAWRRGEDPSEWRKT